MEGKNRKSIFWPFTQAIDNFLREAPVNTSSCPHIRCSVDVKRWMMLVFIALFPCMLSAVWNTGLIKFVYASGDWKLMNEFLRSLDSFSAYWTFIKKDYRFLTIVSTGLGAFLPVMMISYVVGGFWEILFAMIRGHEVSEGFFVTGILFALILPPTIPFWMVAVGITVGVVLGKEVFGGSGMNVVNPALAGRAFLFFAFPSKMSGNVWAGTNTFSVQQSLTQMMKDSGRTLVDGYTQATRLGQFTIAPQVKKVHVDAIGLSTYGKEVDTQQFLEKQMQTWSHGATKHLQELTSVETKEFVTSPLTDGGLGLLPNFYEDAHQFAHMQYGEGSADWISFLGSRLGSFGETSVLACLLGALFLVFVGVASWRTMVAMGLGAYVTALSFEMGSNFYSGHFAAAQYAFPAYKHLLLGGLAFGAIFMATDPVTQPTMNLAKWIYGFFCGIIVIVIRILNPAYPEGVMLAILLGNIFSPLLDHYAAKLYRRRRVLLQ